MVDLEYLDTVQLVKMKLSSDGYATEVVSSIHEVPALFMVNTGRTRGGNQVAVTSDATMYVDPNNATVQDLFTRLEGMLVIARPFGVARPEAWYRIESVVVGQDKLLDNEIDNIECFLKKSTEIPYVS